MRYVMYFRFYGWRYSYNGLNCWVRQVATPKAKSAVSKCSFCGQKWYWEHDQSNNVLFPHLALLMLPPLPGSTQKQQHCTFLLKCCFTSCQSSTSCCLISSILLTCNSQSRCCKTPCLAHAACMPCGLYVLLVLNSFLMNLWAKWSQDLLDRFAENFHHMVGIWS